MVMGAGTVWLRVPFGPFTVTGLAVEGDLDAARDGDGQATDARHA
jgi:hypothetical protein